MTWLEEYDTLQVKVRKVRTSEGARVYDQPIGSVITPDAPGLGGRVDHRHLQGQTRSNFVHPVTGHSMGKTEVGDTFEQLFQAKMRKGLEKEFGCCLKLITGAGQGTARNTPLDFSLGKPPDGRGGEVKTLNARAKNQKTAIKKEEVARKLKAVTEGGMKPLLVVQVVDQDTGTVHVYAHPAFESKAVTRMTEIGSYRFNAKDFEVAQVAAGHWDKAAARAAEQAAKAKGETKAESLARLGDRYDPPDEDGGTIEPGDTVIQLKEIGGRQVPFIYTFPDDSDDEEETKAVAVRRVRTREGAQRYDRPIGSPITPHAPIPSWDLPTVREPKPLYNSPTRPDYIDPREFDDFLDMIDYRLTEQWRVASQTEPNFWAWVVTLPGEDQAAIRQLTGRFLDLMKRKGLGWVIDLEGKSAIRHVRYSEEDMSPVTPSDVRNEDWIKTRTWDIWLGSVLVKTLPQLRQYCYRQGLRLSEFLALPAAEAMPAALAEELALFRQERMAQALTSGEKADVTDDLADWEAFTEDLDEKIVGAAAIVASRRGKGVRRVRSAEGARRFGQPVGSIIKPDLPGDAARRAASHARLSASAPSAQTDRTDRTPGGVVEALAQAMGKDKGKTTRNVQIGIAGKPMKALNEREARLKTDAKYREAFEANLKFIDAAVPKFDDDRPDKHNPEYAAYVNDLNRRLAHALVEPGPIGVRLNDEGKWVPTPEGEKLIDRVVADILGDADRRGVPSDKNREAGESRKVIVAAGVSGAGKTTTLKKHGKALAGIEFNERNVPTNFAVANADDIKEMLRGDLPKEYADLGINPDETAMLTHELSSSANKDLLDVMIDGGYDVVLDGTYQGKYEKKRIPEINMFRDRDYEVTGILVDGQIPTSLERATSRHMALETLVPRKKDGSPDFSGVNLAAEGGVDKFGIPDGGYKGRYVPYSLIGEQVADGRRSDEGPPWDDRPWKSANAMNFQSSIEDGLFTSWVVVSSGGEVVAQGKKKAGGATVKTDVNVYPESTQGKLQVEGKQEKEVMDGKPSETRKNMSKARTRWLAGEKAGTFSFIEAAAKYADGESDWDELVAFAEKWTPKGRKGLTDLGWHDSADAFPQAGTHDELVAARRTGDISWDEYEKLDRILGKK